MSGTGWPPQVRFRGNSPHVRQKKMMAQKKNRKPATPIMSFTVKYGWNATRIQWPVRSRPCAS